jgi:hypothetical protein
MLHSGGIGSIITGHIQVFSLLNPPSYHALSYVWSQEPAVHRVFINSKGMFIQPNLFYALKRTRALRTGQLCI